MLQTSQEQGLSAPLPPPRGGRDGVCRASRETPREHRSARAIASSRRCATRRRPGARRARRGRAPPPRALQNFGIRAVSLAICLSLWQIAAIERRSGAVHHAVPRSRSRPSTWSCNGELWSALWPSLLVLADGADARHRVRHPARPRAGALSHPRRRPDRLHHLPLFDPVGRAGAADRAVGRLRDHRQGHHPVPVRVLPDGDQHLPGRQSGRSEAARRSAARSAARSGSSGPTSCCRARCRSSSPAFGSRSAAA